MVQERSTLQDQIRRRQQGGFIGRQGLIARFEDTLALPPDDPGRIFILNVYGDAGVGKTSLARRLRQVARAAGVGTAYVDQSAADPISAMTVISGELKNDGILLAGFEKRLAEYKKRMREVASDADAPDGIGSLLTKTLVTIGVAAARDIPVAGSVLAPLDPRSVADQADQARRYLVRKFSDQADVQLVMTPEEELTPLFVSGLAQAAGARPIAVFVDTYERAGLFLDDWLRRLYDGRYGGLPETLVVTISGRMPLDSGAWRDYRPIITDARLKPFTVDEARLFLAGKEITDPRTAQVIMSLSGRLPLWLATLADARPANAADVGDPAGGVIQQFLLWEEPSRREVAMAAAFPRILNQDVLSLVAPGEDAGELFGWLSQLPFVSRSGMYWEYHEVVRSAMLRLQLAQAPGQWQSSHASLASAYERWSGEIESRSGRTWGDPRWVDYTREAMYHHLCAAPASNLPAVLESAGQVAEHDSSRLHDWAQLLIDASRDTGDAVLVRYGERLQSLIKGSADELAAYFAEPVPVPADPAEPAAAVAKRAGLPDAPSADILADPISREPASHPAAIPATRQQRQIVVLGAPLAGKTTFLSALSLALARRGGDWNISPADDRSAEQLISYSSALTAGNEFPAATREVEPFRWVLNGWTTRIKRTALRKREYKMPVQIGLDLVDVPGEIMHSSWVGTGVRFGLIDKIARSDGIIFLFDPLRERGIGDTYEFVYGVLAQVMQRTSFLAGGSVGRLPQYIAVCLTKFDDPSIHQIANEFRLVSPSPGKSNSPVVKDDVAREFFERFFARSSYGQTLIPLLESYGNPGRIKYYVTSAVGFHVNPETGVFEPDDPVNVIIDGVNRKPRVRGPLYPINVAEPVLWLCQELTSSADVTR